MANKLFRNPFDKIERTDYQQEFDRTKITYMKCGKEINVYDEIQANREDTEIIPTLRKYGNLKPMEVDYQAMYGEFQNMDLRDVFELRDRAKEMYDNLPAEIKAQFNDDPKEFAEKAPQWLEEKIKTIQPTKTPTNETQPDAGVTNE